MNSIFEKNLEWYALIFSEYVHYHLNNQLRKNKSMRVFAKKKLPFRCIELKNRSEESLGELFCFFILETILLGKALKVNPFDQPSVELIKTETKKILL